MNYLFHTAVAGAEANSQDSGVQGRDRVAGDFITCDAILLPEIKHLAIQCAFVFHVHYAIRVSTSEVGILCTRAKEFV